MKVKPNSMRLIKALSVRPAFVQATLTQLARVTVFAVSGWILASHVLTPWLACFVALTMLLRRRSPPCIQSCAMLVYLLVH